MKHLFKMLVCSVCILYGKSLCSQTPNIVLIMADDMGYECLGVNGGEEYSTPNLDRIAKEGLRFTNCYSQPLCTPSRVKLMTGKYNFRNYEYFGYLNPNEITFGDVLKEVGYTNCVVGKWQLNGLSHKIGNYKDMERPYKLGFDEYCLWQLNRTRSEGERFANPLITQNGEELERDEDSYGPDIFSNYAVDFIERNSGKPFFLYYPMVLVHDPFVPTPDSPEWADPGRRYEKDTSYFSDMMAYTDKIIRQIEAKLMEEKIWENTLFIFLGDNGTHPTIISNTENGLVRGGKGSTINTGNHVPMILSWPKMIKKGEVYEGIVGLEDILPTIAEVSGVDLSSVESDGQSLAFLFDKQNQLKTRDEIFIHYTPRWGKFKHGRWVMDHEYKLYQNGEFYSTVKDHEEQHPLKEKELSKEGKKIKKRFAKILARKEKEYPFELNDKEFLMQN